MYRIPSSISRSVSQHTSPTRGISQYARSAIQAPIIPRYRNDVIIPVNISRHGPSPVMGPVSTQPSIPSPAGVVIPASMTSPFPLPQFTQPLAPHIPTSVATPYPLPHFTQPITPSIPMSGIGMPTGYHHIPTQGVPPSSTPLWPWMLGTAIGVGVGLGVVASQDKAHMGEHVMIPSSYLLPLEAGMGTTSALISDESTFDTTTLDATTMESHIVPVMKSVFKTLFSWVGLCGTFVLLCFVTVIRAKLFPATGSASSSSECTSISTSSGIVYLPSLDFAKESTPTCEAAPLPLPTSSVMIPPLDLETARVTLDATAKTYVEQLIAYYEALQLTTDRMSYSSRQKLNM